jgi:TolB-like protein/DNA-binding winged helix-turn-helix (wHTH) protein/Tfp pilus assembly protein PilF
MEPARQSRVVRFGTYEVSFDSGELRKSGIRIRVQQLPIKVLEILLEHPGEVVSREELCSRLWPNESFGDFDQAVNVAVAKLRSALGDAAENPRYIETLPKRGYRFIADVRSGQPEPAAAPASTSLSPDIPSKVESESTPPLPKSRKRTVLWAFLLLAAVGLGIFAWWRHREQKTAVVAIRSLAVLPLENLSADASQDYFADGMTDELITDLAQISALRVISRTSAMLYKGAHKPLPEIAKELNVDAVVEGTVLYSGDQVRVTAQLIQASSDRHIWAATYQANVRDTLLVQTKVAQAIADQIRIELTPEEKSGLRHMKEVDQDAYENYLKGRYFWNKRTTEGLSKAIDYFNQAIAQDPTYAPAYSGLADSYALAGDWQYALMTTKEALPKAKAAAMKAIELDSSLSEAHTSLAFCLEGFDWNWQQADQEFNQALQLNPGYATGHHWYAWHLALIGKNNEAIAEMKKALDLDPLSLIINADLAELLLIEHFPDESIHQSRKTIEMDPNFAMAHHQLGQAYLAKGLYPQASKEFQEAIQLSNGSPSSIANLIRAYVAMGKTAEAMALLDELKKRSTLGRPYSSELAVAYAALGDKDSAMAWLEKGYEERFNPGVLLRPGFDPLRSDPRFKDLIRRIGLPR